MKKVCLVFAVLFAFFATNSLFAEISTDLNLGFIFGTGGQIKNQELIKGLELKEINASGCGFTVGTDLEFSDYFGIFVDGDFLFPSKTELKYKANGSDFTISNNDMFAIKAVVNFMFGPEFVYHFTDKFKTHFGAGFDMAFVTLESKIKDFDYSYNESGFLAGLALKADATFLFTDHLGLNAGIDIALLFGGRYSGTLVVGKKTTKEEGNITQFMYFIIPNISFVYHF